MDDIIVDLNISSSTFCSNGATPRIRSVQQIVPQNSSDIVEGFQRIMNFAILYERKVLVHFNADIPARIDIDTSSNKTDRACARIPDGRRVGFPGADRGVRRRDGAACGVARRYRNTYILDRNVAFRNAESRVTARSRTKNGFPLILGFYGDRLSRRT